jgi:hypothetical protein
VSASAVLRAMVPVLNTSAALLALAVVFVDAARAAVRLAACVTVMM